MCAGEGVEVDATRFNDSTNSGMLVINVGKEDTMFADGIITYTYTNTHDNPRINGLC